MTILCMLNQLTKKRNFNWIYKYSKINKYSLNDYIIHAKPID